MGTPLACAPVGCCALTDMSKGATFDNGGSRINGCRRQPLLLWNDTVDVVFDFVGDRKV